jgi:hypothetical protein
MDGFPPVGGLVAEEAGGGKPQGSNGVPPATRAQLASDHMVGLMLQIGATQLVRSRAPVSRIESLSGRIDVQQSGTRLARGRNYLIPIYEQGRGRGIGHSFELFARRFEDICRSNSERGFAFILYDFHDNALRTILKDQGAFAKLDRLAGEILDIFYLHSDGKRTERFNSIFKSALGLRMRCSMRDFLQVQAKQIYGCFGCAARKCRPDPRLPGSRSGNRGVQE